MLPRKVVPARKVASTLIGCGGILALLTVAPTHAWNATRQTQLTFSTSIRLPGLTLVAGTYEFSLPERGNGNLTLVWVRDNKYPYTLRYHGLTGAVEHPAGLPESQQVTIGESLKEADLRIVAWYPRGERTGYQFTY